MDDTLYQAELRNSTGIWHVCYLLQALGFFLGGLTWIVAVIIGLIKRPDTRNNLLLYSHATWQIRTFFYGILFSILSGVLFTIGAFTLVIGIGILFMIAGGVVGVFTFFWTIYRIIHGWLLLSEHRPAPIVIVQG